MTQNFLRHNFHILLAAALVGGSPGRSFATAAQAVETTPATQERAAGDPATPTQAHQRAAAATVDAYYQQWLDLMGRKEALDPAEFTERFGVLVEGLFDLDGMAPLVLPDAWPDLTPQEQDALRGALRSSISSKVLAHLGGRVPAGLVLRTQTAEGPGDGTRLEYALTMDEREQVVILHLTRSDAGAWKARDVQVGRSRMLDAYARQAEDLLDDYSFPYLIAELGEYPFAVLEDFEGNAVGELPEGWSWRKRDQDKNKPYRIREEAGGRYLEATDKGESVILGKDIKWDLEKYPYVSFRWRVHEIPKGGDERFDKKVDSAAGLYFIYRKKMMGLIPESVKYVWSSTLPVGSATQRQGQGKPWMVVAGSKKEGLGEWRTFVFDLRAAYKDTFGGNPPHKPIGLGILSDANSTHSHAYADYDDIRVLRTAEPSVTSGVEKILEANKK